MATIKSIEEKAKAYDEAIEKFDVILNLNTVKESGTIFADDVRKIFPELKESEDERIRKELLLDIPKVFPHDKAFRYIAWLEKQGTPQVRTGIEWVNTIDDACDECYAEEYSHGEYCHEQSFKWGFQEGVEWLEKQGGKHIVDNNETVKPIDKVEQKPAVYIPKFHVGDKLVSTYNTSLTYEVLEVGHINGLGNPDYKVEIFTDGKAENPRNIHYMECYKVDEWAKLIEQKHAWSEEDEKCLENAIMYCEWARDKAPDLYCYETSEKSIGWLKSLRPQNTWKPSDEQMDILWDAIVYVEGCNSNFKGCGSVLENLYSDLKELKG